MARNVAKDVDLVADEEDESTLINDVLVNNAGDGSNQPLLEATPEHLEASFATNTYGPLYLSQAVVNIGKMPRGGRIINIGTVVSKMGMTVAAVYAASRAALDSLTASLAGEVMPSFHAHARGDS